MVKREAEIQVSVRDQELFQNARLVARDNNGSVVQHMGTCVSFMGSQDMYGEITHAAPNQGIVCYQCGQPGHKANACTQSAQGGRQRTRGSSSRQM